MRIVIAPDSFKGSMSAVEAAKSIAAGVRDAYPDADIVLVPLADGGEGTVDALVAAVPGSVVKRCRVHGPLGAPLTAQYGLLGPKRDVAVVEMAAASGLTLVPPAFHDVMRSSTYGTGELIRAAAKQPGVKRLIIGLGGSATNDGGVGALAALDVVFYDIEDDLPPEQISALSLPSINYVEVDDVFEIAAEIVIATDVTNPLIGPNGASIVFGPQKGATPEMVATLESYMSEFALVLGGIAYQRGAEWLPDNMSMADEPGGGAAGGLGAALMALYPKAKLSAGIDLVLDTANFDDLLENADLVITGEGSLDRQTLAGKTIAGVLRRTSSRGIRTIALAGQVNEAAASALQLQGLEVAYGLTDLAGSIDDAIARGPVLLRELARKVVANPLRPSATPP